MWESKCVEEDAYEDTVQAFEILAKHLYKCKACDKGLEFYKRVLEFYQQQHSTEVESGESSPSGNSRLLSSSESVPARKPQNPSQTHKEKQSTKKDKHSLISGFACEIFQNPRTLLNIYRNRYKFIKEYR